MVHLCYGTFCKVLLLCSLEDIQKDLHEALMMPIVGYEHPVLAESRASNFFKCKESIPKKVRMIPHSATSEKLTEITQGLADNISEQIKDSMLPSAVAAIWTLIREDRNIQGRTIVDWIRKINKDDLKPDMENAIDFLVGTFLFTLIDTNNKSGIESVYEITSSFIERAYEDYEKNISFNIKKTAEADNCLHNTVNLNPSKPTLSSKYTDRNAYSVTVYQRLVNERDSLIEDINEMSPNSPRLPIKREQLSVLQYEIAEYEQATLETTRLILESPARTELDNHAHELIRCGKDKSKYEAIEEMERAAPSILLTAGVHNGVDKFAKRINANLGDEILVQISFKNISGFRMGSVTGNVVLPDALEFVSDSTIVYNHTHPDGMPNEDGITTEYINLGGYNNYDGKGRGSGNVSFRVKVSQNPDLFVNGVNTLNIVCQVCVYGKGLPSANTCVAYTAIDVKLER